MPQAGNGDEHLRQMQSTFEVFPHGEQVIDKQVYSYCEEHDS
jgi:hypothetical protein